MQGVDEAAVLPGRTGGVVDRAEGRRTQLHVSSPPEKRPRVFVCIMLPSVQSEGTHCGELCLRDALLGVFGLVPGVDVEVAHFSLFLPR